MTAPLSLFPPIQPNRVERLKVSSLHELHVAEYGNPDDPDDWAFISEYSPYQNISAERSCPPVLMTTSTRDDRVHPGHARKMVAKMTDYGHPVYYFENTEGGHAGAANLNQRAYMWALTYAYLWKMLK